MNELISFNYFYIQFRNGDWGLGPNPQSPIPNPHLTILIKIKKNYLYLAKNLIFHEN
jgi:hypothetical protein